MRFLLATDGSAGAMNAEEFLRTLPLSCADDVLIVAAAHVRDGDVVDHLSWCRWRFSERDVRARTAVRFGPPVEVIEATAIEHGCDLIVTGSRGRGEWTGALLGSVARSIARAAVVPLLVVRSRRASPRSVVLVVDGSEAARAATELLARMPLPTSTTISIAGVATGASPDETVAEYACAMLGDRVSDRDEIPGADLAAAVTSIATDPGVDLVVLGTEGQTRVEGALPFSLVDHVLAHARSAVLVARPPFAARPVSAGAALRVASP